MILIVSHRRSGTHFLIDGLRLNIIGINDYYISLKELYSLHGADKTINIINEMLLIKENTIIKCHIPRSNLKKEFVIIMNYLLKRANGNVIYLYRDPRDVLISMSKTNDVNSIKSFNDLVVYSQEISNETYSNNAYTNISYWLHFHRSWLATNKQIIVVNFGELKNNFADTIKNISKKLGFSHRSRIYNVDLSINNNNQKDLRLTTVNYDGSNFNNIIWTNYSNLYLTLFDIYDYTNDFLFQNDNSIDLVIASGIIPCIRVNDIWHILLINNSENNSWEFSKGVVERNESILTTAIRELIEETEIDLKERISCIQTPEILVYSQSYNKYKKIYLFPAIIENAENVHLSEEHIEFKYCSEDTAIEMVNNPEKKSLIKILFDRLNFYSHSISKSKNITIQIKSFISSKDWDTKLYGDLHLELAGSLLNNEYHYSMSDIDLVVVKNEQFIIDKERFHKLINEKIRSLGITSNIGIAYINNNDLINCNDPFWYSFLNNPNINKNQFKSIKVELNYSYELFRIVWYRYLKSYLNNFESVDYEFCKGLCLLGFIFTGGNKFITYAEMRGNVLSNLLITKDENYYLNFLGALDFKLGFINSLNFSSFRIFNGECLKIIDSLENSRINVFTRFLLNMYNNEDCLNDEFVELLEREFQLNIRDEFLNYLNNKSYNLIWIILIKLRIKLFQNEIIDSRFKYDYYILQLENN